MGSLFLRLVCFPVKRGLSYFTPNKGYRRFSRETPSDCVDVDLPRGPLSRFSGFMLDDPNLFLTLVRCPREFGKLPIQILGYRIVWRVPRRPPPPRPVLLF